MPNPFRGLIRSSAFWGKEVREILRQPRMIITLVLGPFMILFIFGIGYQNKAPSFRTLFVAPKGSALAQQIPQVVSSMGPQLIFAGVTDNQAEALDRLRQGEVDIVAVAPDNPLGTVQSNHQAIFTLYHNEVDPLRANWVNYYAYVYVDQVNRRVLESLVARGQSDAARVKQDVQAARANTAALRDATQRGDQAAVIQNTQQLNQNVDSLAAALGTGFAVLGGVQQTVGSPNAGDSSTAPGALADARQNAGALNSSPNDPARIAKIDQDLSVIANDLNQYNNIDPSIVVSPFGNQVKDILPTTVTAVAFFAPAVLALLLQHLAVTLGALSIVRERAIGALELFRVSPLSASEALVGKYLSYFFFGGLVAIALTALMVFGLHLPMLGDWLSFAVVIAGVLFTSLGIGFVISLVSQTDSQAVQYTMLVLLTSVFFSGFILDLNSLLPPVLVVSGLVPTTYGTLLLRDLVLRGLPLNSLLIGGLFALGVILYFIAWWLMRRLISRARA